MYNWEYIERFATDSPNFSIESSIMSSDKKPLKEVAKQNPSQLGDPVSLKAETSDNSPTEHDKGAQSKVPTLKERAEKNPSMLGDPVSLKAETSDKEPVDHDNGPGVSETGVPKKKDSKL